MVFIQKIIIASNDADVMFFGSPIDHYFHRYKNLYLNTLFFIKNNFMYTFFGHKKIHCPEKIRLVAHTFIYTKSQYLC